MATPWDVLAMQGQLPEEAPPQLTPEQLAQLNQMGAAPAPVQAPVSPLQQLQSAEQAALQKQRESIDLYQQNVDKLLKQGNQELDLTPLAAFSDSLFGTNLTKAALATRPMTQEQRVQIAAKLQDELQRRRGEYSKNELEALKTNLMFQLGMAKAGKEEKPTADQSKAGLFGRRMEQAEGVFGELAQQGFDPTTGKAALERVAPEFLKGGVTKQQSQAEENFLNAVLRRESGAAISADEFAKGEKQYFPRIGDTPEVLAQKKANRDLAIEGMKAEAGPAWDKIKVPQTVNDAARKRLAELRKKYGK